MEVRIRFDKAAYIAETQGEGLVRTFKYLTAEAPDGLYYWENDATQVDSLHTIMNSSIIRVNNRYITPLYKQGNSADNLLIEFYSAIENNYFKDSEILVALLIEYEKVHDTLQKFMTQQDHFIDEVFKDELKTLIELLKGEKNENLLFSLFLTILYYILNNEEYKIYLRSCEEIIEKNKLNNYKRYFDQLTMLLNYQGIRTEELDTIYVFKEKDDSLKYKTDIDEYRYANGIIETLSEITNGKTKKIDGIKKEIIEQLTLIKPAILILVGHGDVSTGFVINEGESEKLKIPKEYFNKEDLKNVLSSPDYKKLVLFDFTCNGKHFISDIEYPIEITIFCNSLHPDGTFNNPSAYYYSMGFFRRFTMDSSLEECHQMALNTLALFGKDYIETYTYTLMNGSSLNRKQELSTIEI